MFFASCGAVDRVSAFWCAVSSAACLAMGEVGSVGSNCLATFVNKSAVSRTHLHIEGGAELLQHRLEALKQLGALTKRRSSRDILQHPLEGLRPLSLSGDAERSVPGAGSAGSLLSPVPRDTDGRRLVGSTVPRQSVWRT